MTDRPWPRVAIVSKADSLGGGASRVAELSARLFAHHGIDVIHLMAQAPDSGASRQASRRLPGLTWVERELGVLSRWLGLPDFVSLDWLILTLRTRFAIDVVHLHDISSAFSPWSISVVARWVPVVWTIHDCSPFTGGCLYPMSCDRYLAQCGPCPQLGVWPLVTTTDRTRYMQAVKRGLARRNRYTAVYPSRWIADTAARAGCRPAASHVIPYFVDREVFSPSRREAARQRLGLDPNRTVVLLSSFSLNDARKGAALGMAALQRVRALDPLVLLVGSAGRGGAACLPDLESRALGYLSDERKVAEAYAAADILLLPTLADNLPNVVLEAMASGVPTVGFATGGVPEMVSHGEDGWLVQPGDVEGLAAGLEALTCHPDHRRRLGERAVERARRDYSPERFLQAHLALYAGLTR